MRAMAIEEFGGPERLRAMDLPRPRPQRGEMLIRVVAAGVNPVDAQICRGRLKDLARHGFPLVPGWDVAGVVDELTDGGSRFRKGDRVWAFGRKPTIQWGCYADYVALPESHVALMPAKLLFEEAAAVPLVGLTAYQCVGARPGLAAGSTVLIHGAGGGVGHVAVQLARSRGATVIGTAGPVGRELAASVGATTVIDYTAEDFREVVLRHCPDGVDLVLDTVGGETLAHSYEVVRQGGRLIGIVDAPDPVIAGERGIDVAFVVTEPNAEQLSLLGQLADQRRLRVHLQKIYSLGQAAEALQAVETGLAAGKLVLNL